MKITKSRLEKIIRSQSTQTRKRKSHTKSFDHTMSYRKRRQFNLRTTTLKHWT